MNIKTRTILFYISLIGLIFGGVIDSTELIVISLFGITILLCEYIFTN